jgi:hypothetical protein
MDDKEDDECMTMMTTMDNNNRQWLHEWMIK